MKRLLVFVLALGLVLGGITANSGTVYAKNGTPPGQAKKIEQQYNKNKIMNKLQAALLIASREEGYAAYTAESLVLSNITDCKNLSWQYQKAVSYVVSNKLVPFTTLPNGKILFQPNKPVTFGELMDWMDGTISQEVSEKKYQTVTGTLRFTTTVGDNTWIVLQTENGLFTAYFTPGTVPTGLITGINLTVKVNHQKIIESSLLAPQNIWFNGLVFSIKTNPVSPEVGQTVTFVPQLTNTTHSGITLHNVFYRFTLRKEGGSSEWVLSNTTGQDLFIPAQNSSTPAALTTPSQYWTAPSAGTYLLVKAELKATGYDWQNIAIQQGLQVKNFLNANQSNMETNTEGFLNYGYDTYPGADLSRNTAEKWQGEASLRVLTNSYNSWQGANLNYQGSQLTGPLTFSVYLKAPAGTPLRLKIYDAANSSTPAGGNLEFTASGYWERKIVTFTPAYATGNLALQITLNNSTIGTSFYLDGAQLEAGTAANPWITGGSATNGGFIVLP